jgi:hypothetical protein
VSPLVDHGPLLLRGPLQILLMIATLPPHRVPRGGGGGKGKKKGVQGAKVSDTGLTVRHPASPRT